MEIFNVDFSSFASGKKSGQKEHQAVIAPPKAGLKLLITIAITVVGALLAFYFMLPPISLKAPEFYTYLVLVLVIYGAASFVINGAGTTPAYVPYVVKKRIKIPAIIAGVIIVIAIIGAVASSVVFRASAYKDLLKVSEGTFAEDIEEVDFNTVPLLDGSAAATLGERQIGYLDDMVSQFLIQDDYYNQINYKGHPVRATTLMYADIIKWLTNRSEGLPAYVVVDMVTQKVDIVRMPEGQGIKYSPAEHFGRLLQRHLRFQYPTFIFDKPSFEIDEEGHPYWICPRLDKTIGLFGGKDVVGVVIMDAVTGESEYHEVEELKKNENYQWIDRVYSSDLLIEQYDYHGTLQNGFINSVIGQKGVKVTTEEYNYLAINDDVYLYTGVTSITSDQSIVGFVLINQRTKEATLYQQAGAKENSARDSARGAVQQYGYTATFPLLLNISGQPTYFMSLKDNSNIVKMYAMVNVEQWSVGTAIGKTVEECLDNYVDLMDQQGISIDDDIKVDTDTGTDGETQKPADITVEGTVTDIRSAVKDGNSWYYIKLDSSPSYYSTTASSNESVVILNTGEKLRITVEKNEGAIIPAKKIEKIQ